MADTQIAFSSCPSAEEVAARAAMRILASAKASIAARGRFQLVLAGGSTPLGTYTLLVDRVSDWDRWHIFFGDERCLPADDPGRNSASAARVWLDRMPIPPANRHPIPAELGAEQAATRYALLIRPRLPFDLVLLGMGEDGHTASLFPGHAIADDALVIPVHGAPKPPPDRVSLTPKALTATRGILILVTGSDKRPAIERWRAGADLPITRVACSGPVEVLMDPEAAGTA